MSIVISLILTDKAIIMASDQRAICNDGTINENYKKIYKLKENLYYGMTGTAEEGIILYESLKQLTTSSVSDIIQFINKVFSLGALQDLNVTIAGIDDDGQLFIWQKNTIGDAYRSENGVGKIQSFISTQAEITESVKTYLNQKISNTNDLLQSIKDTICYAADNHYSINKNVDYVIIKRI